MVHMLMTYLVKRLKDFVFGFPIHFLFKRALKIYCIDMVSVWERPKPSVTLPSNQVEDSEVTGIITLQDVFEELLQVNSIYVSLGRVIPRVTETIIKLLKLQLNFKARANQVVEV
jgi:hypothetical protein